MVRRWVAAAAIIPSWEMSSLPRELTWYRRGSRVAAGAGGCRVAVPLGVELVEYGSCPEAASDGVI